MEESSNHQPSEDICSFSGEVLVAVLLMVEKIQTTTWDVEKNGVNKGKNYQPQLVSRI